MKPTDFVVGEKLMWKREQYNCETKNYTPYEQITTVMEIDDLGVRVEEYPGQQRDYTIWVGSKRLDCLTKLGTFDANIILLPRRQK